MGSEYDDFEDELVGSTTQQRNWRGILIALLVIVSVLGLITTAIILVTPNEVKENIGEKLKYSDFMHHKLDPLPFQSFWGADNLLYYRDKDGSAIQYDCSDNSSTTVILNSTFRELDTDIYKISADGKYALLPYNVRKVYSYSFIAKYRILEIETQLHTELTGPIIDGEDLGNDFQYVTWTRDHHSLVAVIKNNIYYLNSWASLKDLDGNFYDVITDDGIDNEVYNGIPDWLYEEEILHTQNAIWMNPDGTGLVYATFNDTDVMKYDIPIYGMTKSKYIENKSMAYPRPNTTNPTVTIKYYNFTSRETSTMNMLSEFRYLYFTSMVWIDNNQVMTVWLNRYHNISTVTVCQVNTGDCDNKYGTEAEAGWLDITQSPLLSSDRQSCYIISSKNDNQYGSYKHIEKIYIDSNKKGIRVFVTSGKLEVQKILALNEETNLIYFLAVNSEDPRERHLYSSTTDSDISNAKSPSCLTCNLYDDCLYVDASFDNNGEYLVLSCLGPGVPTHKLMTSEMTLVQMLENNSVLQESLEGKAVPRIDYKKITTDDGQVMWSKFLLPRTLKTEEILLHNLIVHVNGEPGTQSVTHKFKLDWDDYLVSAHEFIVAYVDIRGTSGRGDDWLYAIHKNIGTIEVDDLITAAKYFRSFGYVEGKMALYGKSHGGFLASSVLGRNEHIFHCGVAVSPITDWRYYDSFTSEKYMGLPREDDNIQGYSRANVSKYVNNFRTSKFLLIHGTGDEKVHFQHSAQVMKSLTQKNVYFKSQIYTDEDHSLSSGNTRNHVYHTIEDFLYQCFDKVHPRDIPPIVIEEEE
ncbi:hypothetical protein ACF0H5_008846 [Mactra antiquata]